MARTKAFDEEEALEGAMELFWSKGYAGTSVQDLVEHLGVSRQSLYDTFGDKHALFLAALERYRQRRSALGKAALTAPGPIRTQLRGFFTATIDRLMSSRDGRSCLIVQTALELKEGDPSSAQCVRRATEELLAALEARFAQAQREGDLGPHHDPKALAAYFINGLNGLHVSARSLPDRASLESAVKVMLSVLG